MVPCCTQAWAAELQGTETLVGRETWSCHLPSVPQVPVLATSRATLTRCPLPSLPELLGSAKRVNVNFQDTDG